MKLSRSRKDPPMKGEKAESSCLSNNVDTDTKVMRAVLAGGSIVVFVK